MSYACKADLVHIANRLGASVTMHDRTDDVLRAVQNQITALQVTIVRLVAGVPRGGTDEDCRIRMQMLHSHAGWDGVWPKLTPKGP
jgi:hypothetical protein